MLDLSPVARRLLERAGVTAVEVSEQCTSCEPELFFSHRRDGGRTGRQAGSYGRAVITGAWKSRARPRQPGSGPRAGGPGVEILAATKYVPVEEMGALAEAGVTLVGENRLQDLEAKRERWGDAFAWDFIGNLQSRKVKAILPLVRLIHSVASDSVLTQLGRHAGPETEVLVEVNVAGEESKGGIAPGGARRVHRSLPGKGRRA